MVGPETAYKVTDNAWLNIHILLLLQKSTVYRYCSSVSQDTLLVTDTALISSTMKSFSQRHSLTLTVLVTTIDALRHFETG